MPGLNCNPTMKVSIEMGYSNCPDQASDDWENAPPGTTHLFRKYRVTHWMQWREGAWFFWNFNDEWAPDPRPEPSYHTPRPGSNAHDLKSEATHTINGGERLYKRGPEKRAMYWSASAGWIASREYRNTDLDNPTKFAPIIYPTQSTEIVFTMTEEQSKAIALDKRPMKVVMVQFQDTPNAKEYAFWAPEGTKTGDFAVVHQNNVTVVSGFPFVVVKVTQDEVLDTSRAHKAILGTFDESFALHVQARIEHMTRVKAKLAQKKKAFEESAFYEMLAKSDPEAAALLDELKQFNL